jgi:hypothetical protein
MSFLISLPKGVIIDASKDERIARRKYLFTSGNLTEGKVIPSVIFDSESLSVFDQELKDRAEGIDRSHKSERGMTIV